MKFIHNCFQHRYRHPFGARPAGTSVRLRVDFETDGEAEVWLHYGYGIRELRYASTRMQRLHPNQKLYTVDLPLPGEACGLYYWFSVRQQGRAEVFYARSRATDVEGRIFDHAPSIEPESPHYPIAFQITVYRPGFETPAWNRGCVMYQIFPDRFARGSDYVESTLAERKPGPEYIFHSDWNEPVDFRGKTKEGYLACDFYGGTLKGIEEKLDYFALLHVDLLYLNPIVRARSNHRYDAGNYKQVDPLLGTEEDFASLCKAAEARGIRIILDGVFSHTGADSIYFNREGRYPGVGAYGEVLGLGQSPYRSWYNLKKQGEKIVYDGWWGFPDLPVLRKEDLLYRDFICGPEGVLAYWLRLGASGFRLDVADELPDDFLREIYAAVKRYRPDGLVLGEVWEDPSNKISYGRYRDFAFGNSLDCVMNYPLCHAVTAFVSGESDAAQLAAECMTQELNLPRAFLFSQMNLLSSHDISRAMMRLLRIPDPGNREAQSQVVLTPEQREQGEKLLRLAYLFLFSYPGAPCVYYGDEIGMDGFRDPFNRQTFRWDEEQRRNREGGGLLQDLRTLGRLRRAFPVLKHGRVKILYAVDRHFILLRYARLHKDAFHRPLEGPDLSVTFLNAGSTPWIFGDHEKRLLRIYGSCPEQLAPYTGMLKVGGHTYSFE